MILLDRLPVLPFTDPGLARLPGLAPLPPVSWICDWPDTADQIRYRRRLIGERRAAVLDCLPEGLPAATELLEVLLAHLESTGWALGSPARVDRDDPLATIGRLVSEDFCLMAPGEDEYRLVGAVLCFPSHWRLAEKIGRPMTEIHAPVPQYDADVGMRVNRFFNRVAAGSLVFRVNWSVSDTPELFTPERHQMTGDPLYLRIERQTFLRLPRSGVLVFGIRTAIAPLTSLTDDEGRAFATAIDALSPEAMDYKRGRTKLMALRERLLAPAG